MVKRFFDVVVGTLCLVFLLPVMIVIAMAIAVESHGPIIFKQRRIGRYNRSFTIYKFRSMRVDTPDLPTDRLQSPKRYITRVGRFLRKSSLDELPQLINIVRGDMSIVGPRPALFNQNELISLRTESNVHLLRPGLTGWAQVNGRDAVDDERKVELDFYYCQHMSLLLDLCIICRTIAVVGAARGVKG